MAASPPPPPLSAADYRPPRRLRHVRAFVVRHLVPPPSAGGALEVEAFATLHCAAPGAASPPGGPGGAASAAGEAAGGALPDHVTRGSVGTAFPEWPCPDASAAAPQPAPPDAARFTLTLRCRPPAEPPPCAASQPHAARQPRTPPAADAASAAAGVAVARAHFDLSALVRVDADVAALRPNAILLRMDDGLLYAAAEAAPPAGPGVGVAAQPAPAARLPGGAPQRATWGDARWDFQRLLGARRAAAHAAAVRARAERDAQAALDAMAAAGGDQAARRAEAEARLRQLQERRRAVQARAAAVAAAMSAAAAAQAARRAALAEARAGLEAKQAALAEARAAFAAPDGRRAALATAQRSLCHARWLAVRQLCAIYPVGPAGGAPSAHAAAAEGLAPPPRAPAGGGWDARLAAANSGAAAAALALAGVPLEALRVSSLPTEPAARERVAAALGYAAAAVALLERILAVPLRYGVAARGSRSAVCDRADAAWPGAPQQRVWYPLYTDGVGDRARFVQAVLLLNKDLERLLNAFGLPAVGPRHTAANLARLFGPALRPPLPQAAADKQDKPVPQGARAQPQRGAP